MVFSNEKRDVLKLLNMFVFMTIHPRYTFNLNTSFTFCKINTLTAVYKTLISF